MSSEPGSAKTFMIRGGGRWVLVRAYDHLDKLHAAANAFDRSDDFSECFACFHPRSAKNGYAGVLRFAIPHLTREIANHELLHAALGIYRRTVSRTAWLGPGCGHREEQLAYIFGQLAGDFEPHFTALTRRRARGQGKPSPVSRK